MGPASRLSDDVCGNYIVNFLFPTLQAQFIGYSLYKFDRILKETISKFKISKARVIVTDCCICLFINRKKYMSRILTLSSF
jgi:hypothetical protein